MEQEAITTEAMTAEQIRKVIADEIESLEREFMEEVDTKDRSTPMDYLRIGEIEGGINSLMRVLVKIA